MRLATAERRPQLNNTVPGTATEYFKDVRKQAAEIPSRIGGSEELAGVAVDLGNVGVAAVDASQIGSVSRHLQVAGHDVVMRADDLVPGLQPVGGPVHRSTPARLSSTSRL